MALGNLFNKAKEAANNMAESAKDITRQNEVNEPDKDEEGFFSKMLAGGTEKVKETLNDISSSNELINEAGYELTEIEATIGIPPEIIPHFVFYKMISKEKQDELLERVQGRKIITLILKALFKSASFQESMTMGGFKMVEVEIQIAFPLPKVNYIFRNKNGQKRNLLIEE